MRLKYNILFIVFVLLVSCDYVDYSGFVTGQYNVEYRMSQLNSLPETTFDSSIDTNNFSFLFITDCHYYKENFGYLKKIKNDSRFSDISFVVINGDNVQSGQQYQYDYLFEDINDLGKPVYAVLGNHDTYNGGYPLFTKHFGRTTYVLHIGQTDLFIIDSANDMLGASQRKWIETEMKKSTAKNKVIMTHASPFDEEMPDCAGTCSYSYQQDVDFLINICNKYHVNYFLSGHLHEFGDVTVKNTRYIKLFQQAKEDHKYAKVNIKNGDISITIY